MASSSREQEPGGFLQPMLPSPPASSVNSPSAARFVLLQPRSRPLKSGSSKESDFINHVEQKLLAISRRYENRFSTTLSEEENPDVEGRGYKNIGEEIQDLNPVVDLVWISGTPSLQIAFLLTIALTMMTSLLCFPFMPRPTFQLLQKLDLMFASLLKGVSVETGEPLPGSETGRSKLSTTEKVRMRGIVERTRIAVVEVAGKDGSLADVSTISQPRMTDTEDDFNLTTEDEDVDVLEDESSHRRWEMDIARVYERTIVELGMALDASGPGNNGGLNIRLAVTDFNKTITPYPLSHQNKESLAHAERAVKEFTERSVTVAETPLVDADGCSLGFLGRNRDMPFFMSHAKPPDPFKEEEMQSSSQSIPQDEDSQDSPLTELSSPGLSPFPDLHDASKADRRSRPLSLPPIFNNSAYQNTTPPGAQAVCLRIRPTKKTFLCAGESKRIKWGHSDMKIDIFLNGDLCSSSYIPESAFYKKDPLRDTFSGVRVGWVTEKPWVLLPSASKVSHFANHSIGKSPISEEVQGRWKEIAQALQFAANSYGRNERNELSPTSDYLQSLANLQMPATLPEMLEAGSKQYAIIDVVVATGRGRKENASAPYLMNPMPLKLEGSRNPSPTRLTQENDALEPRKRVRIAHPTRSAADSEILAQGFSLEYVHRRSAGTVTPAPDNNETRVSADLPNGYRLMDNLTVVPDQSIVETIKTASTTSIVIPPLLSMQAKHTRRNRMKYHDVIDTRQTWEEELKGIVDQAASDAKRLITRSKFADPLDTPDLAASISTAPTTAGLTSETTPRIPSPSKILKLKYRSPTAPSPRPPTLATTSLSPPSRKRNHTTSSPSSPDQPLSQIRPYPPTSRANLIKPDLKLDITAAMPHLPAPAFSTQPPTSPKPQGRTKKTKV
ncbi:MAG: hypothetical protein L6R42_004375, partial [Xanthoria sp. 1 TBL-2021]